MWKVMPMKYQTAMLTVSILGLAVTCAFAAADNEAHLLHFAEKVLPLLKENCYKCHSHESSEMKGGLTLDSRQGWSTGGDSGPAIIPGDVDKSLLIQAVRRLDEDVAMPPKQKQALSSAEVKVLEDWVRNGAADPRVGAAAKAKRPDADWWSLRPLKPTDPPKVAGVSHPIDAFLSVKRAASGLSPSPAADRRTQLRRVTYGLHGLPPTPEALTEFEPDSDEAAYERLVDTLLNSPRYGERWARHWLDTIHFADSHGCEHDEERPNAWPFRDYVIDRLNADIPWQQFIREQLAADVFHPDQKVALGFVGAGPLETSRKGTAPVTFAYLDRDDMVTQTMASFTSTTVNCARCHDHKFDPISREDYYALQAVFAGVDKGSMTYDTDSAEVRAKRQPWEKLLQAVKQRDATILLAAAQKRITKEWMDTHAGDASWEPLEPVIFVSTAGADLRVLPDASILASGKSPATDAYVVTAEPKLKTVTAIKLELLPHESLPHKGPGRAPHNGNLHLNAFTCQLFAPGSKTPVNLPIASAAADFNQDSWTISHVLDADPRTAWGIHPQEGKKHYAIFSLKEPAKLKPGSRIAVTLEQSHGTQHVIGRFRLSVSDSPPEHATVLPPDIQEALNAPEAKRSKEQKIAIAAHVAHQRATAAIAALPSTKRKVYGMNKKSAPLTVNVLSRGNIEKPLEEAHSGALSAIVALDSRFKLKNPKDEASRRAALADWVASPENPLTWRSIVNRAWHYHFGRGICDTPNDVGRMGGKPSHPELLDWLAVWFRDEAKGSLKALHRLIVTSDAYRQQSAIRPQAARIDSDNRLLWRMNTMRLDAEQYRDSVRQISGRINLAMGGPGIKHFVQKKGVFKTPNLNYAAYDWSRGDAGRRDIYRVVWRGIPDPFMEALDFPNLGLLAPTRGRTISPLQSLVLINHDFVLYHSKQLADSIRMPVAHTGLVWRDWRQIGPLTGGDFHQLHAAVLPPEQLLVPGAAVSDLGWLPSKLRDGAAMELNGVNSVFYFHRTVAAQEPVTLTASLGSDDSVKVWLNGKLVHDNKIERGLESAHDTVMLALKPGRNDLLIKVVNGAGPGGIYFKAGAAELIDSGPPVTPEQIADAYRLILQRAPTADEQSATLPYAQKHGLAATCRLLFNTNEFLYVE
jgi:hypothetical protein